MDGCGQGDGEQQDGVAGGAVERAEAGGKVGRYWLIALGLLALGLPARADTRQFAVDELKKHLGDKDAAAIDVAIDPAIGDGGEAFSITVHTGGVKIVGSNGHMALCGTYHLLDLAGYRFLAPQFDHYRGGAEVAPAAALVQFTANPIIKKPQLKFRKLYVEEGHSHDIANLKQLVEWMPKVGYNTLVIPTNYGGSDRVKWDNWRVELTPELQKRGITIEVGGHGYENFINAKMNDGKLFEEHPEWFGVDEKGERSKAKNRVFCTSNPAAVDFVVANVVAYLKARPEIQIFDFWPPDGAKWCGCEQCKKLGEPPDRQAILLKQVTEKLKPVRPDVRLEVIAYSSYLQPPANQAVDPSVLVDFCPISQQFDHQINDPAGATNKGYVDALTAWRKKFTGDISIYSYYRKYAWDSLPVVIPHYMQKDLQWYATLPVQGVSVYSEPADWFTYELNHYVLAALAWDANADVDALVTKFCTARYGGFADQAASILATLEDITRNTGSVPHTTMKSAQVIEADRGRATKIAEDAATMAKEAKDSAVTHSLERLALMCTYLHRDLEIQHLRATKAGPEKIAEKATALHAWVKSHADDGVFLIKNNRLNLNRMLTRYGVGEKRR
jgi:hypothetical protein